jgi:V8-like Glu-specific endopeptidase
MIFYQMETFPGNCGSPIISSCKTANGCAIGIHAYGGSKQQIVENSGFLLGPTINAAIRGVLQSQFLN